jgi:hypothetical protein
MLLVSQAIPLSLTGEGLVLHNGTALLPRENGKLNAAPLHHMHGMLTQQNRKPYRTFSPQD